MVCYRYIIVNTLHKGGNMDDDDDDNDNNNNNNSLHMFHWKSSNTKFHQIRNDKRTEGRAGTPHYAFITQTLKKKTSWYIIHRFYNFWWQWRHPSSLQRAPTSVNVTYRTDISSQIPSRTASATILQSFCVDSRILARNYLQLLCTKLSLIEYTWNLHSGAKQNGGWRNLKRLEATSLHYSVLWPTNAQLFHKLSHSYMFRHYCVILRELVVST